MDYLSASTFDVVLLTVFLFAINSFLVVLTFRVH